MRIGHFNKIKEKKEDAKVSYSPVPFTIALSKRKYDEDQRRKYKIPKKKSADFL